MMIRALKTSEKEVQEYYTCVHEVILMQHC